jgi:hypothetical protein
MNGRESDDAASRAQPDASVDGHDGVPRWVKILAMAGAVVVVLIVVLLLSGHGPGRHA